MNSGLEEPYAGIRSRSEITRTNGHRNGADAEEFGDGLRKRTLVLSKLNADGISKSSGVLTEKNINLKPRRTEF
jgi:hypothetical protein